MSADDTIVYGSFLYQRRLASGNPLTVPFRPVNGPLEPVPVTALKPLDEVERIRMTELVVRAPRPRLKPGVPAAPANVVPAEYQSQNQIAPLPLLKPAAAVHLAADQPLPELKPKPAS